MAGKREKPEGIVMKLWRVEVLEGQGMSAAEAVRRVGIAQQTYYLCRRQHCNTKRPHSSMCYKPSTPEVISSPASPSEAASPATSAAPLRPVIH